MSDTSDETSRGRFDANRFGSMSDAEIDREAEMEYANLGIDPTRLRGRVVSGSGKGASRSYIGTVIYIEWALSQNAAAATPRFFEPRMVLAIRPSRPVK